MKTLFSNYYNIKDKILSSNIFLLILFIVLLLLHLPFLNADPHIIVAYGRDAFTDEGLYSSQVRNYIHFGTLNINESDALIKTPLFSAWLLGWYKIFGISLSISRCSIFFFAVLVLFIVAQISSFSRALTILVSIIAFTSAPFFNYAHYSLAEVPAIICIYAGIIFFTESIIGNKQKPLLISSMFFVASWFFKIQFIYALVIPLIFLLASTVFFTLAFKLDMAKQYFKMLLIIVTSFGLSILLFYILWVLPNEKLFQFIMNEQTQNRLVNKHELYDYITSMYAYYFKSIHLKYLVKIFYVFCVTGLFILCLKPSKQFIIAFMLFALWMMIELHKLFMYYMPMRYLVPIFFCGFVVMALILLENIRLAKKTKFLSMLLLVFNIGICGLYFYNNYKNYSNFYASRKHEIIKTCKYFSNYDFDKKPLMGTWAPSLTWDSKAYILPVWDNYFNNENILEKFNPKIIITENEEQDSNHAISKKNMDIWSRNDSIIYRKVGDWYLKIIWMN